MYDYRLWMINDNLLEEANCPQDKQLSMPFVNGETYFCSTTKILELSESKLKGKILNILKSS
jgi:hypothetical protein